MIDKVFHTFDKDGSGALDKVEIKAMLETILKDGASLVVHSKGRAYKLETLEAAHASGRLDKTTYRDKVNKVTGTEPGAAPSIMEVTDDDVDFVMAEADLDKNGTLDKEEVKAALLDLGFDFNIDKQVDTLMEKADVDKSERAETRTRPCAAAFACAPLTRCGLESRLVRRRH